MAATTAALPLLASILMSLLALTSQAQQTDINEQKRQRSENGIHETTNVHKFVDPPAILTYKMNKVDSAVVTVGGRRLGSFSGRRIVEEEPFTATVTETIEKWGIKVVKNPSDSKLDALGVRSWPRWAFAPSKFPWTYSANETSYLLEGKATVYPEGSEEGVEIGAGDLIDFRKGMSCTWEVSVAVYKHYKFNQ
ncbi:hypothetical protein LINGRAHAP2_LOCUS13506 [Linum grandiflorum]